MTMTGVLIEQCMTAAIAILLVLLLTWLGTDVGYAFMVVGLLAASIALALATCTHRSVSQTQYALAGFLGITLICSGMLVLVAGGLSGWTILPTIVIPLATCWMHGRSMTRAMSRREKFAPKAVAFCFLLLMGSTGLILLVSFWEHGFWFWWLLASSTLALAISLYLTRQQNGRIISK